MRCMIGLAACLAILMLASIGVVFSGIVSFKATEGHTGPVKAAIGNALHRSIAYHATQIKVPNLAAASSENGLRLYEKNCASCHGSPGNPQDKFAKHMSPRPPSLADHASEITPAEIYYVVKYGIMMTGMPAFGPILSDQQLWDVVAAVKRLPDLDPNAHQGSNDGHRHMH